MISTNYYNALACKNQENCLAKFATKKELLPKRFVPRGPGFSIGGVELRPSSLAAIEKIAAAVVTADDTAEYALKKTILHTTVHFSPSFSSKPISDMLKNFSGIKMLSIIRRTLFRSFHHTQHSRSVIIGLGKSIISNGLQAVVKGFIPNVL